MYASTLIITTAQFNILITPARRACLADFGLATVKDSSHLTRTASTQKSVGTVRWQAPELLDSEPQGPTANAKESDVYAFACVCYEVLGLVYIGRPTSVY